MGVFMKFKNSLLLIILLSLFTTGLKAKDANILAYKDRGIKYYPRYVRTGLVKYGKASWYGKPFHRRLTANGERYNMYQMTAAHRTYAMNTVLRVTNLRNHKSVKVRINDRGPFYNTRDIDLSYGAARKLGMVNKGVGKVKIEVLSSGKKRIVKTYAKKRAVISRKASAVNHIIIKKNPNIVRNKKIQIASFFKKKSAENFTKKNRLKNFSIVKKYIKAKKKTAYRIVIRCTPWEAKHLLKSKKFVGAYLIS